MKNEKEETRNELEEKDVNVYTDDCGEIQFHCLNDCFGGGAWLSIEYYYGQKYKFFRRYYHGRKKRIIK